MSFAQPVEDGSSPHSTSDQPQSWRAYLFGHKPHRSSRNPSTQPNGGDRTNPHITWAALPDDSSDDGSDENEPLLPIFRRKKSMSKGDAWALYAVLVMLGLGAGWALGRYTRWSTSEHKGTGPMVPPVWTLPPVSRGWVNRQYVYFQSKICCMRQGYGRGCSRLCCFMGPLAN
jgi:hypothetical protein